MKILRGKYKVKPKVAYHTRYGSMYLGESKQTISDMLLSRYENKVQLIFTSPPFLLNAEKKYGNYLGEDYVNWLAAYAPLFRALLKPRGSIVIEIGNAWESKQPLMSLLPLKSLIQFLERGKLKLCQQFIWNNPAKLPTPAQWVNIKRIRVKDAFTNIWWMSKNVYPTASNRRVLEAYSASMQKLLKNQAYNSGTRPSEHAIGVKSFLKNNKGAIPSNVLTFPNTHSGTQYQLYCKEKAIAPHPARMPEALPEFFIKLLTKPGDIVLDPFAGSNTTGAVAERLKRKWISIEQVKDYIAGSKGRFNKIAR